MSETKTAMPFQADQAAQTGRVLQHQYDLLVADRVAAGSTIGTNYGSEQQELQISMSTQTESILIGTGVVLTEADVLPKDRTPEGRLKIAINVAEEANTLGFSLEGDDLAAQEQARRLIEDYNGYTEPGANDRNSAEYAIRQQAKLLLVESSARDLARRSGIEEPVLNRDTVNHIRERTGVSFADRRYGIEGPVRIVQSGPEKPEVNPNYFGPVGTAIHVSGLGNKAIVAYHGGNPVVRADDGSFQITHGRL